MHEPMIKITLNTRAAVGTKLALTAFKKKHKQALMRPIFSEHKRVVQRYTTDLAQSLIDYQKRQHEIVVTAGDALIIKRILQWHNTRYKNGLNDVFDTLDAGIRLVAQFKESGDIPHE